MEHEKQDVQEMMGDITERGQRMTQTVLTVVHTADTKEQLDTDTATLRSICNAKLCQMGILRFQQMDGLNLDMTRDYADGAMEPAPGMIIFFDWDDKGLSGPQDGLSDHTGIVVRVADGLVYTVEGNSGNQVRERSYPVGYYEILGYGIPLN